MTSRGAATAKRGQLHLLSPLRGFVACVREYLGLIVDILGWLGSKSRGTSGKAPSYERLGARCRSTASHPLPHQFWREMKTTARVCFVGTILLPLSLACCQCNRERFAHRDVELSIYRIRSQGGEV